MAKGPAELLEEMLKKQSGKGPRKGGTAGKGGGIEAKAGCGDPVLEWWDKVELKDVEWVWKGYIPGGKLCVLDGDPDLGKTTVLIDIAARMTRNGWMPDQTQGKEGGVVWISAEDDVADTLARRGIAAGMRMEKVASLHGVETKEGIRPLEIPADIEVVRRAAIQVKASLIVFDPLMAFLCGVDAAKDQDVRRALMALRDVAERHRCTVLGLRHFNKGSSTNALYRGGGSIGIIGAARSGLIIAKDPDEPVKGRVLAVAKLNIGEKGPSLKYHLVEHEIGAMRVEWGGVCPYPIEKLIEPPGSAAEMEEKERGKTKLVEAKEILAEMLREGPRTARECVTTCGKGLISARTAQEAAEALGVVKKWRSTEGVRESWWTLQGASCDGSLDEETC